MADKQVPGFDVLNSIELSLDRANDSTKITNAPAKTILGTGFGVGQTRQSAIATFVEHLPRFAEYPREEINERD